MTRKVVLRDIEDRLGTRYLDAPRPPPADGRSG